MIYLKDYKIFESDEIYRCTKEVEDISQTIKDILLPISDMGYKPSVVNNQVCWGPIFKEATELVIRVVTYTDDRLEISGSNNRLNPVVEEFDRLNDYLESLGYVMYVKYDINGAGGNKTYNDFISSVKSVRNLLFIAKREEL
jgi:hypothetical protein